MFKLRIERRRLFPLAALCLIAAVPAARADILMVCAVPAFPKAPDLVQLKPYDDQACAAIVSSGQSIFVPSGGTGGSGGFVAGVPVFGDYLIEKQFDSTSAQWSSLVANPVKPLTKVVIRQVRPGTKPVEVHTVTLGGVFVTSVSSSSSQEGSGDQQITLNFGTICSLYRLLDSSGTVVSQVQWTWDTVKRVPAPISAC